MSTAQPPLTWYEKLIALMIMPLLMAILCLPIVFFFYRSQLDRRGWVPHWHTVDVYKGDWFDGENRVCAGIQTKPDYKSPKEISALHCPPDLYEPHGGTLAPSANVSVHNLSVLFRGRVSRPGISSADETSGAKFEWNCSRKPDWPFGDQFVCRAIN
jgi:hypothetical protein